MGMGAYQKNESTVEIMSTLMNICGQNNKWWFDMTYDYTPLALVAEIIEVKQARADAKMLNIKSDCEIIYNQYTEQWE